MENYRHGVIPAVELVDAPALLEEENGVAAVLLPRVEGVIMTTIIPTIDAVAMAGKGGEADIIEDGHVPILRGMKTDDAVVEVGGDIAVAAMATMTIGVMIITMAATMVVAVDIMAAAVDRIEDHRHHPRTGPRHMLRNGMRNSPCCVNFCGRRSWRRSRSS